MVNDSPDRWCSLIEGDIHGPKNVYHQPTVQSSELLPIAEEEPEDQRTKFYATGKTMLISIDKRKHEDQCCSLSATDFTDLLKPPVNSLVSTNLRFDRIFCPSFRLNRQSPFRWRRSFPRYITIVGWCANIVGDIRKRICIETQEENFGYLLHFLFI